MCPAAACPRRTPCKGRLPWLLSPQGLLGVTATDVRPDLLAVANWEALPDALPVIALAFVFQNVVPIITTSLEGDVRKIRWGPRAARLVPAACRSLCVGLPLK